MTPLNEGDVERVLAGRGPKPERRKQRESRARVDGRAQNAPATQRGIESIDSIHRTSRQDSRVARLRGPGQGINAAGSLQQRRACLHPFFRAPSPLIEVDGENENGADGDVLPERLHTGNHQSVPQHGRNERANHAPADGSNAAK